MRHGLAIVCTLVFVVWIVARVIAGITFSRECEGYLKRAADANTIELAVKNLEIAIGYADTHGLTSGYTSILYTTPDEDIGFWYENLAASLEELRGIKPEAPQLEKTNVLMKLRETLLDEGQGVSVTAPSGISVYPNNSFYAFWGWLSAIFSIVLWIAAVNESPY